MIQDVKARLATVLQGVTGIGKVYTFRRNLNAEKDQALLAAGGRLHVWFVYRDMTQLKDTDVNEALVEQWDTMVIEGFMSVEDSAETEELFDSVIDAVLQAVNADRRPTNSNGTLLGGNVTTAMTPSVRKYEWAIYGQSAVLCHHVEIAMKVVPRYLQ